MRHDGEARVGERVRVMGFEGRIIDTQLLECRRMNRHPLSVEVLGDRRCCPVELDTGQLHALGREPDEVPRPAAGFEHRCPRLHAQFGRGLPHRLDDGSRRVVRVQRGSPRLGPCALGAKESTKLDPLIGEPVIGLVEDLRDRSPPRPAGEHLLFAGRRPPVALGVAPIQHLERGEIRTELRCSARWREIVLTLRPEGRGPRRLSLLFPYSAE